MFKKSLLFVAIPFLSVLISSAYWYNQDNFFLGGIQINEPDQQKWTAALQAANMNTVEVTIYAKQGEWDSDSLEVPTTDAGALAEIRAAKKAGLKVALILRVALDHNFEKNLFLWHGMILPNGDKKINSWFQRYAFFVSSWAKIAEKEGVDMLSVGSEMNALSSTIPIQKMPKLYAHYNSIISQKGWESRNFKFQKELQAEDLWVRGFDNYPDLKSYIDDRIKYHHKWAQQTTFADQPNRIELMNARRDLVRKNWRAIIKQTRTIFGGKLTYSANFDNYMMVDFWDDLDFIGINAYFPLQDANKNFDTDIALKAGLIKGWEDVFEEINKFRTQLTILDKPIIFTELGYIFRENTTLAPWEGFGFSVVGNGDKQRLVIWGKEKISYTERKLALDALYEVVSSQKINLRGILYWKLTSIESQLSFEPFGLALSPHAKDPLQTSLAKFRNLD